MRIVVHIGVHKTGSSALQQFLFQNTKQLEEVGISYVPPLPTAWPNHNPLADAFRDNGFALPGRGEVGMAKLLSEATAGTALISAEILCEADVDIDRFMATVRGHEVEVIAYVRHPCDIVISAFNEVVRHFETHWTRPINELPFAYDPSHLNVLRGWIERDDVKLVLAPYDRAQWPYGSLYADFLGMLNVPLAGFSTGVHKVNESVSFAAADVLRVLNTTNPTREQHAVMLEHLRKVGLRDGAYPLTPESVAMCLGSMEEALPIMRPYFRAGFREQYLLAPRH